MTGRFSFSVPLWMDAIELTAPVAQGDTVIHLDTVGRAFKEDGICMLWKDRWTWEAFAIASVEADQLHLQSAATVAWPITGTLCIPLVAARALEDLQVQHLNGEVAEIDSTFSMEPV